MAVDPDLVDRIRARLATADGITELRMFGGWGVMVHGNLAVGVMDRDLIVRVGPDAFDAALRRKGARPFDFTGRPMTGWVYVDGTTLTSARALHPWVDRGLAFARSLPSKADRPRARRQPAR